MIGRWSQARPGKWTVWRYHWIAHHGVLSALERARAHASGDLLDLGCGTKPFAPAFAGRVRSYRGVDLPDSRFIAHADRGRAPDVHGRAEALPFRDRAFDTVLGLSMLTYLPEPGRALDEAFRVLRPGGALLLEFTQMAPLHDAPHDYLRFTRYGATWLLERAGFEVVEAIPIGGLWARVALSLLDPLNRLNRGPTRVLTEIPVRALYVAIQLLAFLLDRVARNPDEPLGHLMVARKRG